MLAEHEIRAALHANRVVPVTVPAPTSMARRDFSSWQKS